MDVRISRRTLRRVMRGLGIMGTVLAVAIRHGPPHLFRFSRLATGNRAVSRTGTEQHNQARLPFQGGLRLRVLRRN